MIKTFIVFVLISLSFLLNGCSKESEQVQNSPKEDSNSKSNKNDIIHSRDELLMLGKTVYKKNCEVCHGDMGQGLIPAFPALTKGSSFSGMTELEVLEIVIYGGKIMPKFDALTDNEISAVIAYTADEFLKEKMIIEPSAILDSRIYLRKGSNECLKVAEHAETIANARDTGLSKELVLSTYDSGTRTKIKSIVDYVFSNKQISASQIREDFLYVCVKELESKT